jgi:hypothetical protein
VRLPRATRLLVLSERHLRRILTRYFAYYHRARTHLSLEKDAPDGRPVEPPDVGKVVQISEVGGLHHRYVRRAAKSRIAWPAHRYRGSTPVLSFLPAVLYPILRTTPLHGRRPMTSGR